ncbi:MAG: hypothetical protein E7539_03035 [Ruminococcaceae bacterium]|nr:hypothetical protein [Oscillospiraceae bacterium]
MKKVLALIGFVALVAAAVAGILYFLKLRRDAEAEEEFCLDDYDFDDLDCDDCDCAYGCDCDAEAEAAPAEEADAE